MISEQEARAWIEAYGLAWTSQDTDKVVRLFTKDASYRERRFHPGVNGIDGIHDYWELIVVELQREVGFEAVSVAVAGDCAYINWRANFTWRPLTGVLELDAMTRIRFVAETRDGLRLASSFEEWIEHREA